MSVFDITNIAFVGIRKLVNTDHTIRSMVKLSFTGHAADKINMRSLRNMKKEITNPVGENPDHKWGLLRETWSGAIERGIPSSICPAAERPCRLS